RISRDWSSDVCSSGLARRHYSDPNHASSLDSGSDAGTNWALDGSTDSMDGGMGSTPNDDDAGPSELPLLGSKRGGHYWFDFCEENGRASCRDTRWHTR